MNICRLIVYSLKNCLSQLLIKPSSFNNAPLASTHLMARNLSSSSQHMHFWRGETIHTPDPGAHVPAQQNSLLFSEKIAKQAKLIVWRTRERIIEWPSLRGGGTCSHLRLSSHCPRSWKHLANKLNDWKVSCPLCKAHQWQQFN